MSMGLTDLSTDQLRRAVAVKEQIESLERQLASLLGGGGAVGRPPGGGRRGGRRTMSASARARIAAAQRARWARHKAGKPAAARVGGRKRRRMSAEARARIAAAQRARWARVKGG